MTRALAATKSAAASKSGAFFMPTVHQPGRAPVLNKTATSEGGHLPRRPVARAQRIGLRVGVPVQPLRPYRLAQPDFRQDRAEDRVARGRAVLGVHGPQQALTAGRTDQLVEQPVVDLFPVG